MFKKKPLDAKGKSYLPKARCVARGDLQEAYIDLDPTNLFAPVAAHESLRLILAYAASTNLVLEGGDISKAYLYGSMDKTIFMEQPADSSDVPRKPKHVCALQKSLYAVRQAGNIWGSVLHKELMQLGFKVSKFDSRVYFFKAKQHFIIIAIVVDDMFLAANNRTILEELKTKLRATFDVKLYMAQCNPSLAGKSHTPPKESKSTRPSMPKCSCRLPAWKTAILFVCRYQPMPTSFVSTPTTNGCPNENITYTVQSLVVFSISQSAPDRTFLFQ